VIETVLEAAQGAAPTQVVTEEPPPQPSEPLGPQPPEPPEPPAPLVAEPEPVALSVLAHGAAPVDEEPTGSSPPGVAPGGGVAAPPRQPEAPGSGSGKHRPGGGRRRVLLILAATAVLVGASLGVIGSLLRDDEDPDGTSGAAPTGTDSAGDPVPTLTSEPSQTGPPQPQVENPDLAFDFLEIKSDGVTLTLAWNDPTEGEGRFVLSEVSPEKTLIRQFSPGTTEAEIAFPLSEGERACFVLVVAMPTGDIGVAEPRPRCVTLEKQR